MKIGLLGRARSGRLPRAGRRSRRGGRRGGRRAGPRSRASCAGARATSTEILAASDLIVELIGGTEPAREYVLAALEAGKPVVSANKQLIAQHGDELFAAARAAGVELRFEAAVAGAVPVIRTLQEGLGPIPIERVSGIVNGTTNFILSEMAASGASYEEVLGRAQELGYAEADPTDESRALTPRRRWRSSRGRLPHAGDSTTSPTGDHRVRPDDIAYAKELGLSLKLLGIASASARGSACACSLLPLPRPPARAGRGPSTRSPSRLRRSPRS